MLNSFNARAEMQRRKGTQGFPEGQSGPIFFCVLAAMR